MTPRLFMPVIVAVALAVAALAAPLPGIQPANAAANLKITLSCYSNPERTKITNTGTVSVKINSVGSTYQPYSAEPFAVSKTLAPGQYVTYQTGRAASGAYRLYGNYIYNDNGRDGARVRSTAGTFTKSC